MIVGPSNQYMAIHGVSSNLLRKSATIFTASQQCVQVNWVPRKPNGLSSVPLKQLEGYLPHIQTHLYIYIYVCIYIYTYIIYIYIICCWLYIRLYSIKSLHVSPYNIPIKPTINKKAPLYLLLSLGGNPTSHYIIWLQIDVSIFCRDHIFMYTYNWKCKQREIHKGFPIVTKNPYITTGWVHYHFWLIGVPRIPICLLIAQPFLMMNLPTKESLLQPVI